jgi:hypothetical protein
MLDLPLKHLWGGRDNGTALIDRVIGEDRQALRARVPGPKVIPTIHHG